MRQNIKQEIMEAAKQLFSQKGYNDTSMRDIAEALHISVGNLTYHYKRKEDLIEAILLQDHQRYRKTEPFYTLEELNDLFCRNIEQKTTRPYYFRYFTQLAQICPSVYEMQMSVMDDLRDVLTQSFRNFVANGTLKAEFAPDYGKIVRVITTVMVYDSPDFYQSAEEGPDFSILQCVWSVLVPCLTEQGYAEYRRLFP